MSLISQVAKMLGVESGEEFKVEGYKGVFYFLDSCLAYKPSNTEEDTEEYVDSILVDLLNGRNKIIKLPRVPWKPRLDEKYYTFCLENFSSFHWRIFKTDWFETPTDFARLKVGWVYRTYAEAKEALPIVAKEIGVRYIIEGE